MGVDTCTPGVVGRGYTWRVTHVYTSTRGREAALVGGYAAEDRCLERKERCVSALHLHASAFNQNIRGEGSRTYASGLDPPPSVDARTLTAPLQGVEGVDLLYRVLCSRPLPCSTTVPSARVCFLSCVFCLLVAFCRSPRTLAKPPADRSLCYRRLLSNILMQRHRSANSIGASSQALYRALEKHQLISSEGTIIILKLIVSLCLAFNSISTVYLNWVIFVCLGSKRGSLEMFNCVGWPLSRHTTRENMYACYLMLVTCIIMRRIKSLSRWSDMKTMLDRHASQLSEMFWEGLEKFLSFRQALFPDFVPHSF